MANDKLLLADRIDALLPQTQCTQCDYPDCMAYATALAEGNADINQCPPGGTEGIQKLAALLGVIPKTLNAAHGVYKPKAVAVIDESSCIGCTFCIQACPVDAIVGAAKQMHTVFTAACTGCELCVTPCPMDCIAIVTIIKSMDVVNKSSQEEANLARERHQFRLQRLSSVQSKQKKRQAQEIAVRVSDKKITLTAGERKHATIQAALKRALEARRQAMAEK